MCQLILANLGSPALNKIFVSSMIQISAAAGNGDGTGFVHLNSKGKMSVWKSKMAGDEISNLGVILRDNITASHPVMAHVRAASKGIDVKDENAHPFEGERYILAHNGRFYGKDEEVSWSASSSDDSIASDSLQFLNKLEEISKSSPDKPVLELLNMTMGNFKGKFALLIYDKKTDDFYVARGDSADLHILKFFEETLSKEQDGETVIIKRPMGFLVNTRKPSLNDAAMISTAIAQATTSKDVYPDNIEELKKNTLYKVTKKDLVEVGELKENAVTYHSTSNVNRAASSSATGQVNTNFPEWKYADKVYEFMSKNFLTIQDLENILLMFLGTGIADLTLADLEDLVKKVIPMLSAPKKIRKRLGDALGGGKIYPVIYDNLPKLQYPWMLNDPKEIDDLIKYIKARNAR